MTGFARARSGDEEPVVTVTLRTVNHRFLDLKIRTPPELESSDPIIRRIVKKRLKRGSVQATIALSGDAASAPKLNRPLARAYLEAYRELAAEAGGEASPDLTALLRAPGVLTSAEGASDEEAERALAARVESTLEAALTILNEARANEGETVLVELRERASTIAAETEKLRESVAGTTRIFEQRLERRMSELLDKTGIEPQRLAQEAALLADRADISEELQRLAAHAVRLNEILDGGGEAGKQIDFLAQEMNREANTALSKCSGLGGEGMAATDAGLQLKAEIEKIREQAQNLE